MRAAPAVQVTLLRFGAWRWGVLSITALSMLSLAGWLVTREAPVEAVGAVMVAVAVAVVAVAVGMALLARSLLCCPPIELRWDGHAWSVGAPDRAAEPPLAGEMSVAIDLGAWMLLRFVPEPAGRSLWLPVQRRGLAAPWHALRCAVHAPHRRPPVDPPPEP